MSGISIGQRWTRKRGRGELPPELVVRNLFRPDSQVLVRYPAGNQATLKVRELKRNYRPTEERIVG